MSRQSKKKRVLAVASSGGHWLELRRLYPAFSHHEVHWASVSDFYRDSVPSNEPFHLVRDATRWNPFSAVVMAFQLFALVHKLRPDVVISTGALPGLVSLCCGRLFRAKTIWVDSLANIDELSLSGKRAGRFADLWLTQWEQLSKEDGPDYKGGIL